MKYVKKRAKARVLDNEDAIRKLTLKELKTNPRWKIIWKIYEEKKKMFPDLDDKTLLEQTKTQILVIRQLSRSGIM